MTTRYVGEIVLQQNGILDNIPEFLQNVVSEFVAFIPRLVGALVILLIGWIIGAAIGKLVHRVADGVGIDRRAQDTPLGRMAGRSEDPVSTLLGKLAAWFVYALAILTAADALAIPVLSQWIATAVSYLPAFIAGLLVIVLGFVVADFIGDAIMQTRAATQTEYTSWFAKGTRMFLYFTAIVIGLDTMGVDVGILFVFANALAWGLAAAVAIGVGIAVGWGGHTYVAENIDRWMGRASAGTPAPHNSPQADGGEASEVRRASSDRSSDGSEQNPSDGGE